MRRFRLLLPLAALSVAPAGCHEKTEEIVVLRTPVGWQAVSTVPVADVADGFVSLAPQGTDGLFPASVAVARLSMPDVSASTVSTEPSEQHALLDTHPPNDLLPWNSLFDSLRYVHDAFPLNIHDLSGDAPDPSRLVHAAARLRAGVCLVYGAGDPSESSSLVRGVIYDTRDGRALAAIQASVSVEDPESLPQPPDQVEDDHRHCDPRYLADRRFEQLVFDCLRSLKSRDRPVAPQRQEGWTPELPAWQPTRAGQVTGAP